MISDVLQRDYWWLTAKYYWNQQILNSTFRNLIWLEFVGDISGKAWQIIGLCFRMVQFWICSNNRWFTIARIINKCWVQFPRINKWVSVCSILWWNSAKCVDWLMMKFALLQYVCKIWQCIKYFTFQSTQVKVLKF